MQIADLPSLNATLNTVATFLLICGWVCIKLKRKAAHVVFMVAALVVSAAFLTSYLVYHFKAGHVEFHGPGWSRKIYYPLLLSHVMLAVVILPMVIMTIVPALRERRGRPRRSPTRGAWRPTAT